jgi:hypothetical protein
MHAPVHAALTVGKPSEEPARCENCCGQAKTATCPRQRC